MSNIVPLKSMFPTLNHWPNFFDEDDLQLFSTSTKNELDVYETDNQVVVKANVAGVDSKDVDVTFEKGVLWIEAKKVEEQQDEKNKYYNKSSWNYSYRVTVPGMIDHTKEPDVTLNNGVLKVVFSKSEASKPKKLSVRTE
jgi:HSP20 family protein